MEILGWGLLIYFLIGEPVVERIQYLKFFKIWEKDKEARTRLYRQAFFRNWGLGIFLIIAVWIMGVPFSELGFRPIDFQHFRSYPILVQTLSLLFLIGYFFYFYFIPTVGIHLSKRMRQYVIYKITPMQHIAPRNKEEYFWWVANAFTSTVEELLYRGFIFFFLPLVFLGIPIWVVAVVSLFLDALRYFPRLNAMSFVAVTGVAFTLAFLMFNSLFAAMLLHVIHDLRALAVPFHLVRKEIAMRDQQSSVERA